MSDRLHEAIEELSYALPSGSFDEVSQLVAELESALASERAKRVAERAHYIRVSAEVEERALAAEATIEQAHAVAAEMSDDPEYLLELLWRSRIMDAIANTDTSALARHDAEVKTEAWDAGYNDLRKHLISLGRDLNVGYDMGFVRNPYRARAAALRTQADD